MTNTPISGKCRLNTRPESTRSTVDSRRTSRVTALPLQLILPAPRAIVKPKLRLSEVKQQQFSLQVPL